MSPPRAWGAQTPSLVKKWPMPLPRWHRARRQRVPAGTGDRQWFQEGQRGPGLRGHSKRGGTRLPPCMAIGGLLNKTWREMWGWGRGSRGAGGPVGDTATAGSSSTSLGGPR